MPVRALEIWSDVACAGGSRLAIIPDALEAGDVVALEGEHRLDLVLRYESPAFPQLREGRVLRVSWTDGTIEEWRILAPTREIDGAGALRARVRCESILQDLAGRGEICRRAEVTGLVVHDFTLLGLTPTELIDAAIVPAAPSWVERGTIDPTDRRDFTFDWMTPLAALRELATLTECELALRRNGDTDYRIDLVNAIGSSATTAYLLRGKNVATLSRETSAEALITRVYPRGGGEEGEVRTIARAPWKVSAVSAGSYLELQDPAGGDGPAQVADQFNGLYARRVDGTLQAITDTTVISAGTTRLAMASTTGFTVGDLIELRRTSGGEDVTFLDDPAAQALYGVYARLLDRADLPPTRNLVANPMLNGVYTGGLPASWTKIGTPTCSENTDALYTRYGGKSLRLQTTVHGQGVETAAIAVAPTAAAPYVSAFASVFLAALTGAAKLRIELYDVTNDQVWPDPTVRLALSTETGVWLEIFGPPNGYDAFAAGCASVQLRLLQEGAGTLDVYVDGGQVTPTADLEAFFGGDGPRQLWQAGNVALTSENAPAVSAAVDVVDLTRLDGTRFPVDALVLGGTVIVRHPSLGVDLTTRIVRRERNLLVPAETKLQLSNQREGMVDASTRPTRRPRRLRLSTVQGAFRDLLVRLGTATPVATDSSIQVSVVPTTSVGFWRLHLVQGSSLPTDQVSDANLIDERLNDPGSPSYDSILATGLLGGTQYAWRAVPYNRDGVRVPEAELTGATSTTGTAPWLLSGFTVTGSGSTDQLRWSHDTDALPSGYTVDVLVDKGGGAEALATGRDPRLDADGTDAVDASGDGGYDHTVDVTGAASRTRTYILQLRNSGGTLLQTLTKNSTRAYAVAGAPDLVSVGLSEVGGDICAATGTWRLTPSWSTTAPNDSDYKIRIKVSTEETPSTFSTLVDDRTTASSSYQHDTGLEGNTGGVTIPTTHWRTYRIELVRRSDGNVMESLDTATESITFYTDACP